MSTVFQTTQRPVLFLCKVVGIINISYTSGPDGLLIRNANSIYNSFLEFTRMIVLIIFSWAVHNRTLLQHKLSIFKIWAIIISARISEKWIIKFINGIIEYDQKLSSVLTVSFEHRRPIEKKCWNIIYCCTFVYYVAISMMLLRIFPIKDIDIVAISMYFIRLGNIVDITVVISSYFYLQNLECRFQTLNNFWTQLPDGFTTIPVIVGGWSNLEIVMMLDNVRRLHSELSDLLRIFSISFGQILLAFFVFSYIDIIFKLFNLIHFIGFTIWTDSVNAVLVKLITFLVYLQDLFFVMSIIIAASRVKDTKRKMISYLRLIRISILPSDIKLQVRYFMNQLTVFDLDEITAFGIFNINLNLVMSIIILLITGFITLIQMKNQTFTLHFYNNSLEFYQNLTKMFKNTTSLS